MHRLLAVVVLTSALTGCGGPAPESYTPQGDLAKKALETSLDAWKAGKKAADVGKLAEQGPALQVIDSDWETGMKLESYEITAAGDAVSADSVVREFSVSLQFAGAKTPQEVKYHVVGKDPLLVFRDKDFVQTQGM